MKTFIRNKTVNLVLTFVLLFTSMFVLTTNAKAADVSVSDVTGLQDAVTNAADGDVITLEGGFAYGNATIAMPNVNVTIDGGNNVWNVGTITVNGAGTGTLTIQNLKMDGSGALPVDMRLINIESSAGKVILENIELYGANYLVNASAGAIGISTTGTAITEINKAYIHDNKANGGPAIKISENSTSNIFINNSTIERNSGHQGGWEAGAITAKYFRGTLEINNSVFRENKNRAANTGVVGGGGGAMSIHYLFGGQININESLFERNETSGEGIPPAPTYDGGAIYILDADDSAVINIDKTTFDSNLAHDDGGAIMIQGRHLGNKISTTNITNSTFYNNRAYGVSGGNLSGGAIQFFRGGGAFTNAKMTNNILSSTFINNVSGGPNTTINQAGGAIGLSGVSKAPLTRNDSLFIGNQVYGSNGEINYASSNKDVSNNTTTQDGTFNLINVDKELDEVATKAKLKEVLGTSTPVLLESYSIIKAGVDGEIIKTIPIKPESRADNTYTGTVAAPADDQRAYGRYKDQGAVEISWVKYNANGGAFGLDEMTSYDGKVYYEKDAEDNAETNAIKDKITSYYTVGYIAGNTKVLDGEADLDVTNEGKVFLGWSTDKDAKEADENYPVGKELTYVSENLTLYAVWGEYSKDITVKKVDENNKELNGAKFKLYKMIPQEPGEPGDPGAGEGRIGRERIFIDDKEYELYKEFEITENGKVEIKLGEGDYVLKEVIAPAGYELKEDYVIKIKVSPSEPNEPTEFVIVNKKIDDALRVRYYGNGNTSGTVPVDAKEYDTNETVTVLGNTGNLVKGGYEFKGWNTKADGTGTTYNAGDTFNILENTSLYAIWNKLDSEPEVDKPTDYSSIIWDWGHEPVKEDTKLHRAYINGYPDGSVKPQGEITRGEVAAIMSRLHADVEEIDYSVETKYDDVKSTDWYAKHIAYVSDKGLMEGYEDGTFKPEEKITRAEYATVVARFKNLEQVETTFEDSKDHWASGYIGAVASEKWITGYPDGSFKPANNISREEVATMTNKMLDRKVDEAGINNLSIKKFIDLEFGTWSYYEIVEASNTHEYVRRDSNSIVEDWKEIIEK